MPMLRELTRIQQAGIFVYESLNIFLRYWHGRTRLVIGILHVCMDTCFAICICYARSTDLRYRYMAARLTAFWVTFVDVEDVIESQLSDYRARRY